MILKVMALDDIGQLIEAVQPMVDEQANLKVFNLQTEILFNLFFVNSVTGDQNSRLTEHKIKIMEAFNEIEFFKTIRLRDGNQERSFLNEIDPKNTKKNFLSSTKENFKTFVEILREEEYSIISELKVDRKLDLFELHEKLKELLDRHHMKHIPQNLGLLKAQVLEQIGHTKRSTPKMSCISLKDAVR